MAFSEAYIANFNTLVRAAKNDDLALMECTDRATGVVRAVLCCAMQHKDGTIDMVPFGHLCPGNPYEAYEPAK